MKPSISLRKTVKYFYYFISLSFYFSYGYFALDKFRYNGLIRFPAV